MLNVPTGIPAAGMLSVTLIPVSGVANPDAITQTEATAVGAVNASCHLMGDGYGRTTTQASDARRRACEAYSYDVPGIRTVAWDQMRFVYDPQNPDAEVSKVYAALTEGEEYFIVERIGVSGKTEIAGGQYYDAYRTRLDVKEKLVPGESGELEFGASFTNLGEPVKDKQIQPAGG